MPQISLIMGPCAGGGVYSPAITDFIFMVKETSYMFITGPDVIRTVTGEDVDAESLGGAMAHATKSGVAHFAAEDEDACLQDARYLLSFLPQNNLESAPRVLPSDERDRMDPELDHVVPDSPNRPYDMRDAIRRIVDDGEFMEVQEHHAREHRLRLRAPRRPCHRRRGQPARAARRRARHRREREGGAVRPHLRRVQRPARDVRGRPRLPARHEPGVGRDHPPRREAAVRLRGGDGPKITVITRKAYGGAYDVMASKHLRADYNVAWPTAEVAVMGPEGAVNIVHRRALAAHDSPDERRAELIDDYRARFANPYTAAERGYLDDVIVPHETRPKLITALETLLTKREASPQRKHGNIPL